MQNKVKYRSLVVSKPLSVDKKPIVIRSFSDKKEKL
jgi:hypothetical protein